MLVNCFHYWWRMISACLRVFMWKITLCNDYEIKVKKRSYNDKSAIRQKERR